MLNLFAFSPNRPTGPIQSSIRNVCVYLDISIGAKPNLYCEAIELVCGGSPIGCGHVERKAQDRVKWEG